MRDDLQVLKQQTDLRMLVENDLGQPKIRSGRANLYKCPFHKERKGFSLAVWADGYRCFGKCDTSGDAIDWLMQFRQLSFTQSESILRSGSTFTPQLKHNRTHSQVMTCEPPTNEWQSSATQVVEMAENILWSGEGKRALDYLFGRGLTTSTIRQARLGYIPNDYWSRREVYSMRVPSGISIPWFAHDALWAVKVRRSIREPRYIQIAGSSSHGLYNADSLPNNPIVVFCEGEFDTLILQQEAGLLVSPVTLGSATNRLSVHWLNELVFHKQILVAYDNDIAGRNGTQRLLQTSARFQSLDLPNAKDINAFYCDHGDVFHWISNRIGEQ